ncbi:VOC family protein [Mesorhizobium sp.]|uniref:VOC family protein n=1 Tax=Mesorhizobium sp. TaxID=1871066 RepID=UPI0025D7B187|nr:VOC family protein [Mesorhizobium sp.]
MARVSGYHHLTLSTDSAQEDFDFYTKALGLHSVKRTVLFDGVIPVYHLYYGSPNGDASTIITTFPFRKPGVYGRRGSNQSRTIMQSIPKGAADFWVDRLNARGIEAIKAPTVRLSHIPAVSRMSWWKATGIHARPSPTKRRASARPTASRESTAPWWR